jgi:hypothetical protein
LEKLIPYPNQTNNNTYTHYKQFYILPTTTRKTPGYTFFNKILFLRCGDIEKNPGPKFTLLLNHPQIQQEKYNTYFYKNTTQIKIEYIHIFELFKPYLTHTHIENTNPHLKQFCINNQQYPHNHLFYAILITLAPTPTQCNQLISENFTRWTLILLKKKTNNPTPLPTEPHTLQKFH